MSIQGMLDEHFVQLEELEAENPHFAEEVMTMFFRDSTKLLATVERALDTPQVNVSQIDQYLHQLQGSSSSVGAAKVFSEINKLRALLRDSENERCSGNLMNLRFNQWQCWTINQMEENSFIRLMLGHTDFFLC